MTTIRSLVEITVNGTMYRLSNEWISDLTNPWDGYIIDSPVMNARIKTSHGGEFAMAVGSIGISQTFFNEISAWPPPETIGVAWYVTASTEAAKDLYFVATGNKPPGSIDGSGQLVYYDLKKLDLATQTLDDGYSYDDTTVYYVVNPPTYQWTISGAGPEYVLTTTPGDWPGTKPDRVQINYSVADEGTVGSLAVGEWGWSGGQLYARITGDVDPDSQIAGYIRADYGTVATPLERAFGPVEFMAPTRLPDAMIYGFAYAVYNGAYISGTGAKAFTAVSDNGSGQPRFACLTHGFSTSDVVTTEVDPSHVYTDTSAVTVIDANTFDKTSLAYTSTAVGHAYMDGYWRTYDNGVPNSGNMALINGNFFTAYIPTGEFAVSGTGYNDARSAINSNLSSVLTWVATRLGLSLTTLAVVESPSPPIDHWQTEQMPIVDFLSDVTAYYKHLFFFDSDSSTLFPVDLEQGFGPLTLTEFQVRKGVRHGVEGRPVSLLRASWTTRNWVDLQGTYSVSNFPMSASVPVSNQEFGPVLNVKVFNTDRQDVEARLALIGAVLERENVEFTVKLGPPSSFGAAFNVTRPGTAWSFTNTYNVDDLIVLGRIVMIQYQFDKETMTLQVKQTT